MKFGKGLTETMAKKVRYHVLFEQDLVEATEWYDQQIFGLGDQFKKSIRASVESIIVDPERFPIDDYGDRYKQATRFPYLIFFDVTNDEILMLGVYHTSRSRKNFIGRKSDT